jgi:hypothetical protein
MVSVTKGFVNYFPSLFKSKLFFINQNSQKFNCSYSWMCIIKLNSVFRRECSKFIIVVLFVSSNDIIQTRWTKEVLLFQSELFTIICRIIRIQNTCDIFSFLSFLDSTLVITFVKSIKIKIFLRSWSPKSQVVCVVSIKTWDWCIVSHSNNPLTINPTWSFDPVFSVLFSFTVKPYFISDILSFNLPWITMV